MVVPVAIAGHLSFAWHDDNGSLDEKYLCIHEALFASEENAVLVSLFIAGIKYLTKSDGRKVYLGSKLRVWSTMAAKACELEQEVAGYITLAVKEQKVERMCELAIKTLGLLLLTEV